MRPESSFLHAEKPHFFLPAHSLARAHPTQAPLSEKSILHFPAIPFSPQKKSQQVSCAPARGSRRFARGERRLCRRLVRTTTPGLSPGETFILQFWDGLLGGTSRPGCQSVCASPPLLLLLLPGAPRGAPWQYQVLCSAGSLRWEISCASLGCDGEVFFCPEATGPWFAALPRSPFAKGSRRTRRTAICTSFSQNPSYHFNL